MNYPDIISKVSKELDLPEIVVDRIYRAYWLSIKHHILTLPLKENISKEEFSKLRTNFNIPSLGKLCVTWDRLIGCKKRFEIIKKIREKNKDKIL